ncbi:MAG TPA: hypothetical protein VFJ82_09165 [Longimicrobium sp.]|nr:hypothetical protein [Longimicrobium sp.]
MTTITIQQFRATLDGVRDRGPVRTYREIARRPELATAMRTVDWGAWPPVAAPVATA